MNSNGDIGYGLELMARLGEVMPDEAGEEVGAVYEDIQNRLRVPFVNFLFRTLANYPDYLSFAWGRLSPHLLSADFERACEGLRSRALVQPVTEKLELGWMSEEDLTKFRAFTDTIHYVLPKLLLVVTAFDKGLSGAPGVENSAPNVVEPGIAEGTLALPMVSTEDAAGELSTLFERIRDLHGHPNVASYYRGLGNWPILLQDLWAKLEPMVGSDAYAERKRELLESSRDAVFTMPLPQRMNVDALGLDESDVEELQSILAVFRYRVVPDTFLEVQAIKAMLDGSGSALSSRFNFA